MENTFLNILMVGSFAFVSVALGLKWSIQCLVDYRMARHGMKMLREMDIVEDEEDEEI
jgi:hypothetical protein